MRCDHCRTARPRSAVDHRWDRPLSVLLMLASLTLPGCEMLAWLKPHQLWKLNREPPLGGRNSMFSVPTEVTPDAKFETRSPEYEAFRPL